MIENSFNRRGFLKVLGWGGATVALSGCGNTSVEDGKEFVTSYVQTADYIIPSIGWVRDYGASARGACT